MPVQTANQRLAPQQERQHQGPVLKCQTAMPGEPAEGEEPCCEPGSYLQVIIEAATEVHVPQGHVRQLGTQEAAQLGTDVHGRLLGTSLLVRRDRHPPPVVGEQLLLQRQAEARLLQLHLAPLGRWLGLRGAKKVCETEGKVLRSRVIPR